MIYLKLKQLVSNSSLLVILLQDRLRLIIMSVPDRYFQHNTVYYKEILLELKILL